MCTTFICIAQSGPEEVRRFAQATEGKTHALKYIAQDPNFLNRFIAILDEED